MQRHILLVLLMCYFLTMTIVTSEENQNRRKDIIDTNSENRHKLPIFPKNTLKFVVTTKAQMDSLKTQKTIEKTVARKPIMPQLTLKPTTESITTKVASRKPLMKLRTFTIKTVSNGKYRMRDNSQKDKAKNLIQTDKPKTKNDKLFSEDVSQEFNEQEESRINVEKVPHLNNEQNKNELNSDESTESKISSNNFLPGEDEDRNEFIFLDKDEKLTFNDLIDRIGKDFDDDFETTTMFDLEKTLRVKRSKNIIEEENMASTISGFRYTGKETEFNNDIYFKNINS